MSRRSSGSRSDSETSFVPGIGSLPAASSRPRSIGAEILPRPNQLPRRSRTRHRTRVGRDPALAGSRETMTSSSVWKSSAPPCTGRAQTSSTMKSGTISRIRQGRASCAAFGSLMPPPTTATSGRAFVVSTSWRSFPSRMGGSRRSDRRAYQVDAAHKPGVTRPVLPSQLFRSSPSAVARYLSSSPRGFRRFRPARCSRTVRHCRPGLPGGLASNDPLVNTLADESVASG